MAIRDNAGEQAKAIHNMHLREHAENVRYFWPVGGACGA